MYQNVNCIKYLDDMKKLIFITTIILMSQLGFTQDYNDKQNMEVVMQQDAFYPAGEMALYKYMFTNVKYSDEAKANDAEGDVMTSFNVETDSTVSNIVIIKGVGFGIDDEIKRILGEMKFAPAIQNGERTKMNLMFNFPVRAH